MRRTPFAKSALGLLLGAQALCANAAQVTLSGWLYGSGPSVSFSTPDGLYRSPAGAVIGTLSGTAGLDATPFISYSVELSTADLRFGPRVISYAVVAGASYFESRLGDAGIAEQLAQLMTYANDHSSLVSSASGSAALQLAIWSTVQTEPVALGVTLDADLAHTLLDGAVTVSSRYNVWVLESAGSVDLLLLSTRGATASASDVPEPGSLALVLGALLSAAAAATAAAPKRRR